MFEPNKIFISYSKQLNWLFLSTDHWTIACANFVRQN